jgi:AraC family transcriptional regulator
MSLELPVGCFFGNRVQARELAGFLLTDYNHGPGDCIRSHHHERSFFGLVVAGGYTETCGGRNRECDAATVVFHPAGERHAERIWDGGARVFHVEAVTHWLREAPEYRAALEAPAVVRGGVLARLTFRIYREFRRSDAFSRLAVEGLVLELLAERSRREPGPAKLHPPWLLRVREVLHARFPALPSLTGLAREVGVHPVHLARTFRAHFGCPIGEYVRQLRIDYACRRLAEGNTPLVEIALAAGFTDQSHFVRTFKRLRGLTPAAFRRLGRAR